MNIVELTDENKIDSSSIVHDNVLLSKIVDNFYSNLNWKYATVDSTKKKSGDVRYVEIGNLVIVQVNQLRFNENVVHNNEIATNLPAGTSGVFSLLQTTGAEILKVTRLKVTDGVLKPYWSTFTVYDDTNESMNGTLYYIKNKA